MNLAIARANMAGGYSERYVKFMIYDSQHVNQPFDYFLYVQVLFAAANADQRLHDDETVPWGFSAHFPQQTLTDSDALSVNLFWLALYSRVIGILFGAKENVDHVENSVFCKLGWFFCCISQ